jgi:hypothetical protein
VQGPDNNEMQFQTLFDSVCRCFGHNPTSPTGGGHSGVLSNTASQPISNSASHSSDVKRRTNRLELRDKEWDALFEGGRSPEGVNGGGGGGGGKPSRDSHHHHQHHQGNDLEHAQAVAKAKLAANPSRYRSKRKRPGRSRDDIFRTKQPLEQSYTAASAHQTAFSRLLNPSVALCFATPIRGTGEEPDDAVLRSTDNSDANTLNTCEDTITSTLYFDAKYSHVVETRPPMPLFNQFKLGHQKDEIRTIVATDSHSSLKMLRLLQGDHDTPRSRPADFEDSSSDSDGGDIPPSAARPPKPPRQTRKDVDQRMADVPDVKAISSSTDSSKGSGRSAEAQKHQRTNGRH